MDLELLPRCRREEERPLVVVREAEEREVIFLERRVSSTADLMRPRDRLEL